MGSLPLLLLHIVHVLAYLIFLFTCFKIHLYPFEGIRADTEHGRRGAY